MVLFGELTDEVGISVVGEAWMIWFWWESNDDDDDHNVDGDYDYDDDDVDVDVDDDDVDDDDVDDDDVDDDVDDEILPSILSRPDNVASWSDRSRTRVGDCVHVRSVSDRQMNQLILALLGTSSMIVKTL